MMNTEYEITFKKVTYTTQTVYSLNRESAIEQAWESLEDDDAEYDLESVVDNGTDHNFTEEDIK